MQVLHIERWTCPWFDSSEMIPLLLSILNVFSSPVERTSGWPRKAWVQSFLQMLSRVLVYSLALSGSSSDWPFFLQRNAVWRLRLGGGGREKKCHHASVCCDSRQSSDIWPTPQRCTEVCGLKSLLKTKCCLASHVIFPWIYLRWGPCGEVGLLEDRTYIFSKVLAQIPN